MGRFAFLLAAGISMSGAIIHFAAPWLGPEWYAILQAPPKVVASAQSGGLLAPTSALLIGLLMLACAAYALTGAGILRWLPFAQMVQGAVAAVCLLRGLLVLPYLYKFPDRFWTFDVVASLIWVAAGLAFLFGIMSARNPRTANISESSEAQARGV